MTTKLIRVCNYCGSPRVFADAYVNLNDPEDVATFDDVFCEKCDGPASVTTVKVPKDFSIETDVYDFDGATR